MKRNLLSILLAVVLLASCFGTTVNAADPTPTNVGNWSWIEDFSGTDLSDKWTYTTSGNSSASVADGKATLVNNVNEEAKLRYDDIPASNKYVLETQMKTTWATDNKGVVSIIFFTGGGVRIHSQIYANRILVRNAIGEFYEYAFNFNDSQYHTIRYEVELTGVGTDVPAGTYKLFVDGAYLGTGDMQPMDGKRLEILNKPNADATITTDIEYVKYVALDPAPISRWSYEEQFDYNNEAAFTSAGWQVARNGTTSNQTLAFSDSAMQITNTASQNFTFTMANNPDIIASENFIVEVRAKVPATRLSIFAYSGVKYRLNCQIAKNVIAIQDENGDMQSYSVTNDGSAYHTYRFECNGAKCKVYFDGFCVATTTLNPNPSASSVGLETNGNMTALVDYVKHTITSTPVSTWTWEENFTQTTDMNKWRAEPNGDSSNAINSGALSMTNNQGGESKVFYAYDKTNLTFKNFVLQARMHSTFVNVSGAKKGATAINFMTESSLRIFVVVEPNQIKIRNPLDVGDESDAGWDFYDYNFDDGKYHTVRCEFSIADDGESGTYKLFVDGNFLGTGSVNKGPASSEICLLNNPRVESGTILSNFDYVKYVDLDYTSQASENVDAGFDPGTPNPPENGGDVTTTTINGADPPDTGITAPDDDSSSPSIGGVIVSVAFVAAATLTGVVVSKKRR